MEMVNDEQRKDIRSWMELQEDSIEPSMEMVNDAQRKDIRSWMELQEDSIERNIN